MHNLNLGPTAPTRSINARWALGLRLHGTAALLVLLIAGPAGLTARQQPAQPQQQQPAQPQQQRPAQPQQQQPAQPQQQQPAQPQQQQKPQTFDPYYYPGRPAPVRRAVAPAPDQSKKTTAPGKPTTPAKAAPSKQPAKTKRTASSPHAPIAHQSVAARKTDTAHKAPAVPVDSKKSTSDSNPDVQGKFGSGVGSYRACLKGDNSPDGTVTEGFRKVVTPTAVGPSCHWEKVE